MSLNPDYLKELFIDQVKPCLSKGGGDIPAVIQALTVTENGTYEAPEGVDGYSPVMVEVASTGGGDIDALIDKSITEVSSNVTSVGNYAFYSCSSLTTADFPVATSVGNSAFYYCSSLTTAEFPVAMSVSNSAFNNCKALTTAELPVVTSIGDSAFYSCSSLTTADFPVVTSIGNSAFYSCSSLTTADFPVATSIGSSAFRSCSKLTTLILRSETMATLSNTNALSSTSIVKGTGYIYVPSALIEQYKADSNWSTYAAQFRALEDYTVDGTTTGALDDSKI